MAPRRAALAEIDINRVAGGELTPHARGFIQGMKYIGASGCHIAGVVKVAESTVRSTIPKASQRNEGKSISRIGRPKSYSKRDERHIIRTVRLNPKIT